MTTRPHPRRRIGVLRAPAITVSPIPGIRAALGWEWPFGPRVVPEQYFGADPLLLEVDREDLGTTAVPTGTRRP